jgi:hypothetical protein
MLTYLYFGAKKDGFYIDIGANDGKSYSNTFIFENIGWDGICVEPLPIVYKLLMQNRQCDCFNVAVSETRGKKGRWVRSLIKFMQEKGYKVYLDLGIDIMFIKES